MASQSLGGVIGPIFGATTFAWSISPSGRTFALVDHRLVFNITAVLMILMATLVWKYLTLEIMTEIVEEEEEEDASEGSEEDEEKEKEEKESETEEGGTWNASPSSPHPLASNDKTDSDEPRSLVIKDRRADLV